jgi:Tol biopolymer transport system component
VLRKLGVEKAREAFEKVVRNYPGQAAAVAMAQAKLYAILRAATLAKKDAPELTIRTVQIPPDPPLELNRVSPDGKYLAYVDANTGDLGVREFSTGNLRRLTNEGKNYSNYAYDPRWSQDSTRLAFAWQRADGFVELRVIALDGSPPREVLRAKEKEAVAPQDWSSDGSRILTHFYTFYTKERAQELSLVSVADGSVRILKAFKNYSVGPDLCFLTPDGRTVAYSRPSQEGARERDVFLLSLDSSREIPLVEHPADDTLLEWLPDGRGSCS